MLLKPRRAAQTTDPDRRLHCPFYRTCLSKAARKRWPGFTCSECHHQDRTPNVASDEWVAEAAACARLMQAVDRQAVFEGGLWRPLLPTLADRRYFRRGNSTPGERRDPGPRAAVDADRLNRPLAGEVRKP